MPRETTRAEARTEPSLPRNSPDQAVSEAVTACQDRIRNGRTSRAPAGGRQPAGASYYVASIAFGATNGSISEIG